MNFKRIYIEITNICNLNCSFCSPLKREKKSMSLSEIEHILKEISDCNAHIYPHIKGEPLIHPNFKEFTELLKKYNLPLNITTNGVLISNHSHTLSENARQVNISVHSLLDGQIKDKKKYLKDIIDFGISAKEKGTPHVSYRLWTEDKNKEFSEESYEIIKEFSKSYNIEIPREIKKGRDAIKLSQNVYISLMNKFIWPTLKETNKRSFGNCLGGKEMIGILADGTVVPCCLDADGVINLGNIFKESLYEILNKERYLNLKKGFLGDVISEELCKKCSFFESRKAK